MMDIWPGCTETRAATATTGRTLHYAILIWTLVMLLLLDILLYNHPVNPISLNYIIYQLCRMMSSDIKVRKLHLLSHCVVLRLFHSFYTDEKWILESRNKTNDQSFDFGCCQCWKYLFI